MPWTISWLGVTRDRLQILARERFPHLKNPGQSVVEKVEEEIRLHPLPADDLPQVRGEQVLRLGSIEVAYCVDSQTGNAEIRNVSVL
jgi:hypothetical protein